MKKSTLPHLLTLAALCAASAAWADDAKVDFQRDVQPIFKQYCIGCHSLDPKKPKKKAAADFRLDDMDAAMKGGRSGKAIIPGDAKNSLLVKLLYGPVPRPVKGEEDKDIDPMPHVKKGRKWKPIPKDKIKTIEDWINQGANR